MRLPRFRLLSLVIAVAVVGLVLGVFVLRSNPRRARVALAPLVVSEVRERFAPQDAESVIDALETADLPSPESYPLSARVHLALIRSSEGDWRKFREALDFAEIDWRDALVAAGLADEDWPEVLKRDGYRVP